MPDVTRSPWSSGEYSPDRGGDIILGAFNNDTAILRRVKKNGRSLAGAGHLGEGVPGPPIISGG